MNPQSRTASVAAVAVSGVRLALVLERHENLVGEITGPMQQFAVGFGEGRDVHQSAEVYGCRLR